ncbi:shikimate dehydrogenase [Maritimibacter sp. UBA3975]|uniref:shikimate dehydrogenase n=1 Tax=Maritimibacter sp. UBA3975 TaxID=1946833 RepID=UPI000C0AECBA|nr:shikimate dehydrogenase [Maritimibacter sp. UBA3975]MAM63319.1 shikimate dehydrogenase [Maritimibacter sp.]|tara:strand:- start:28182 stop:29060 length:879 start_codon:yes stop_codon:yes gene_type:complete
MASGPLQERTSKAPADHPRAVRVGLVGRGIQLSRTPAMHIAEGTALGLDYRYDLIDTDTIAEAPALSDLIAQAEAQGFAGLNVTFPYKRDVIALLDELSPAAQKVGAVNTVVFANGRRRGHNTDFWGFAESLRRGLPDAARDSVLLLGAGGAGGAVAHALRDVGVKNLAIFDRSGGAAQALAAAVGGRAITDLEAATRDADGIVNTTPMGMAKLPGMAIDPNLIDARHWVADIVYFPRETALLAAARAKGCRVLDGSGMAVFQAVRAFELFSGLVPDENRMRATFEAFTETT